jgi:energy-converting hydrogenase Eha subunit F
MWIMPDTFCVYLVLFLLVGFVVAVAYGPRGTGAAAA